MPIYEYRCSDCEHRFEEFFSKMPKEDEILAVECPKCKSKNVVRWYGHSAGFILKGGGWYRDGYGSNTPQPSEVSSGGSDD